MAQPTIKEILAGVPQGFDTLLALLNQTKMGQQHYGPNDSIIASAIMHPGEGINKAGEWMQNQVSAASQAPLQPYIDPRRAEQAVNAGINLAGMAQTGAMPFAPSGPGTLGSIKSLSNLQEALALRAQKQGATNKQLWQDFQAFPWKKLNGITGDYDTAMLGEIPDTTAFIKDTPFSEVKTVGDLLAHPLLFNEYKDLAKFPLEASKVNTGGSYKWGNKIEIGTPLDPSSKLLGSPLSILLHEIGHYAQKQLSLPSYGRINNKLIAGGPEYIKANAGLKIRDMRAISDIIKNSGNGFRDFSLSGKNPYNEVYRSLSNEAQARMIQKRLSLDAEQLKNISPIDTLNSMGYSPDSLLWP